VARIYWVRPTGAYAATGGRVAAFAVAAVALAAVRIPHRPPTVCLLRALTGIPCPFCGGTTSAVHAGHGDVLGALTANPLVALGSVVFATAPFTGVLRRYEALPRRAQIGIVAALLVASETWQLVRFGLLHR
jgi:hypothetical protein